MAVNPPLTNIPTGGLFPTPFTGEYFALRREGVDLEIKDLPFPLQKYPLISHLLTKHRAPWIRCLVKQRRGKDEALWCCRAIESFLSPTISEEVCLDRWPNNLYQKCVF